MAERRLLDCQPRDRVATGVVGFRFDPGDPLAVRWVMAVLLAAIAVVHMRLPRRAIPRCQIREALKEMCTTVTTLRTPIEYVTTILQKLGTRDRTQAAIRARERGLL